MKIVLVLVILFADTDGNLHTLTRVFPYPDKQSCEVALQNQDFLPYGGSGYCKEEEIND